MFSPENKKFLYVAGGIFVALIIALVILVIVSNKNSAKKREQARNNVLTIWGTNDDAKALEASINLFQDTHTDVKIEYIKKDPENFLKDSLAEIAAGKGPDIWIVPNEWMVKYHNQMVAMPDNLIAKPKEKKSDSEVYKETFPNAIYNDNVFDSKVYGLPLSVDMLKLFYNPTIFAETISNYRKDHPNETNDSLNRIFSTGPKNWDDVVTITNLTTQKNGNDITRSAIALGNTSNIADSVSLITLMMLQNGAQMTSDDNLSATFQTKQAEFGAINYPGSSALSFYTSFADPNNQNYTWNNNMPDSVRAFAEGKTAMMIDFESKKADIKRISPNLNFQTINVPQIKETLNPVNLSKYYSFTVSKAASNPQLSWNFITSLMDSTNLRTYLMITKRTTAKVSTDPNDPIKTLGTWYNPDPEKTPEIFKTMINQVNEGKNSQTSVEYAASQITTLLHKLKE